MEFMNVNWEKDKYNLFWCRFDSDILNDPRLTRKFQIGFESCELDVSGVYIIWEGINNNKTLYVGSGYIKQRFREHLRKPEFQNYGIYATWAIPPLRPVHTNPFRYPTLNRFRATDLLKSTNPLPGIEKYLGFMLNPTLNKRLPENVDWIVVNLPEWEIPENPLRTNYIQRNKSRWNTLK